MEKSKLSPEKLALIVVCVVLNLGIGFIVASIRLPFYLDSIGTVVSAYLLGPVIGIIVGITTVLIGSIYTPTLWAYGGTAIVIALYVGSVRKFGYLEKWVRTIIFGILLGVISAILSAPVTAILYGGVSLAGTDVLTALFRATGKTIMESVVLGGLATDPFDKLLTSIIAMLLIMRLPQSFKRKDAK
ncbi:MAG: hypothetical protein KKD92_11435 [Proteobacteria bacterium]|nr:hypothetical protein [Pseudomonadota bacterium]